MKLRKACHEDTEAMMEIVKQAQSDLKKMNVNQWQNGYPNEHVLHQDIELEKAYVMTADHQIIGLMVISIKDETTYDPLKTWIREDYLVIHRFAVRKEMQRTGVASQMIQEASVIAKQHQLDSLRIDTHEKNVRMRRFLEKNHFEQRGFISLKDGSPRIAYELILPLN